MRRNKQNYEGERDMLRQGRLEVEFEFNEAKKVNWLIVYFTPRPRTLSIWPGVIDSVETRRVINVVQTTDQTKLL